MRDSSGETIHMLETHDPKFEIDQDPLTYDDVLFGLDIKKYGFTNITKSYEEMDVLDPV